MMMAVGGQSGITLGQLNGGSISLTPQAQNGLLGAGQATLQSNTALSSMRPDISGPSQFYLA